MIGIPLALKAFAASPNARAAALGGILVIALFSGVLYWRHTIQEEATEVANQKWEQRMVDLEKKQQDFLDEVRRESTALGAASRSAQAKQTKILSEATSKLLAEVGDIKPGSFTVINPETNTCEFKPAFKEALTAVRNSLPQGAAK